MTHESLVLAVVLGTMATIIACIWIPQGINWHLRRKLRHQMEINARIQRDLAAATAALDKSAADLATAQANAVNADTLAALAAMEAKLGIVEPLPAQ
jgi:23S rRNA G2445 N2-methylase RlmL